MARTAYTDFVGENMKCCIPYCYKRRGYRPGTISDPHHVRSKGAIGQRDECNVVPLCWEHHQGGHSIGWRTFANRYQVCLPAVALATFIEVSATLCADNICNDLSF